MRLLRCLPDIIIIFLITLALSAPVFAGERLLIAVAANFILPSGELVELFEAQTGITVDVTYSSTGKLFAQILKGAPYDIFFAADEKRPRLLEKEGFADRPFVYARGRIVLWTADKELCGFDSWQAVVMHSGVRKIAVANTESAPYGTAAMITLQAAGLWDSMKDKYVFPQTVAQAFQYAETGSADAGFCAYSSALSDEGSRGCSYAVPESPPIVQAACILKRTENRSAAERFVAFMNSSKASEIKERYGYR